MIVVRTREGHYLNWPVRQKTMTTAWVSMKELLARTSKIWVCVKAVTAHTVKDLFLF